MGFSLTGAICSPVAREDLAPGAVLWCMDEILECDYINRAVQGVIMEGAVIQHCVHCYPKELAGTAFISLLFKRYLSYAKKHSAEVDAPPFWFRKGLKKLVDVQDFSHLPTYKRREYEWEDIGPGEQRLAHQTLFSDHEWPSIFSQYKHNEEIESKKEAYADAFLEEPYSWLPCTVVAEWMGEFWESESTSRRLLEKSVRAQARLKGWQSQLSAYGQHGARLLLIPYGYPFL